MPKINLSKSHDYIVRVLDTQQKAIPYTLMYGDGSIHNYDKEGFILLYNKILKEFGWFIENNLSI